jgi:hypothetical protein
LTAVQAELATENVHLKRSKLSVTGTALAATPGEFEFDLGASVPVDRVNLALPDRNSILQVQLQSRANPSGPWLPALKHGFYRMETRNGEMSNGPVVIPPTAHRYWLARMGQQVGSLGSLAPRLQVEWIAEPPPHKAPWLWVAAALGVAFLLWLGYRLSKPRRRL